MKSLQVIVHCPEGLHLRVASEVVKIAKRSGATVHVFCEGGSRADACSALQLMTLGACEGTALKIVADGDNEETVLGELENFFKPGDAV